MVRLKINKLITGLPRGECAVEVLDHEGKVNHLYVLNEYVKGGYLLVEEVKSICEQFIVSLPGVVWRGQQEITVHRSQLIS